MPKYRKDQYLLARFQGDNGDLIVGRIESVRNIKGGTLLIDNLLSVGTDTFSFSNKKVSVVSERMVIVPKATAMKVVAFYHKAIAQVTTGRDRMVVKNEARHLAVELARPFKTKQAAKDSVAEGQEKLPFSAKPPEESKIAEGNSDTDTLKWALSMTSLWVESLLARKEHLRIPPALVTHLTDTRDVLRNHIRETAKDQSLPRLGAPCAGSPCMVGN